MALLTAAHAAARKDGIAVGQVAAPELLAELERNGWRLTQGTEELRIAREGLEYVLDHHADGEECLCPAARSVAAAALSLTEQKS